MTKTGMHLALVIGLLGVGSTAQAELIDADNGLVNDTVLNICWVADAGLSGAKSWDHLVDWAADLEYGGYDDWRLASMSVEGGLPTGSADTVVDCGIVDEVDCRDNELSYMYTYYLPGSYGADKTGDKSVGSVTLTNIRSLYWSGTEYPQLQGFAWNFHPDFGGDDVDDKDDGDFQYYGWAVRPGQCRAAPPASVPAVGALGLGLLGLMLVGVARSRLR